MSLRIYAAATFPPLGPERVARRGKRREARVEWSPLTATEFELLRVLSLNAGRVVTFDTLLRRVWNAREGADANPVRIFVRNLRYKLGEDAGNPTWIFNERGVGYRLASPGEE